MENLGNYLKGKPVWFLELSLWLLYYCDFIEPSYLHCTTPKEKKSDPWHPTRFNPTQISPQIHIASDWVRVWVWSMLYTTLIHLKDKVFFPLSYTLFLSERGPTFRTAAGNRARTPPCRITTRLCLKFKHTVFPRIKAGAIIRGILINFQSLNRRWSVLLDHLQFNLTRRW